MEGVHANIVSIEMKTCSPVVLKNNCNNSDSKESVASYFESAIYPTEELKTRKCIFTHLKHRV